MEFAEYSDSEFRSRFIEILRDKMGKNNTYKFALARFLLEHSRDSTSVIVTYQNIADCFFKYYWLQECKSRLRQGPKNQNPKIITIIRKEFPNKTYPLKFDDMCIKYHEKVERCRKQIAAVCRKDVIHRFQSVNGLEEKMFYDYFAKHHHTSGNATTDPHGGILLNVNAMEFLKENFAPLYKSTILEWIRFIERRNLGVPNLVKKIEGIVDGPRNQAKYRNVLTPFEPDCFYCGYRLDSKKTHVDHVLPFDYIADTNLWNLVLACQKCNCEKLGHLPPEYYIDKLINRNHMHKNDIRGLEKSLDTLNFDSHDISRHYSNAKDYGYVVLKKFPKNRKR
ncbi:MAG: HNH endonuclease [Thaumarchaeota archaeon]|nr:HNH endonuclease [Nitrososphaerota archaeon]